jgi:hypothetical protein
MMNSIKKFLKEIPVVNAVAARIRKSRKKGPSFDGSSNYWEARYATGGNSGAGSYGRLAVYKAKVLNDFVAEHKIASVIEFGCGDGHQLSLAKYPLYIGLDVAPAALKICKNKFTNDRSKTFRRYTGNGALSAIKADLVLSLDVIYHLVEDHVYEQYMRDLFECATRFVIIYASDQEGAQRHHERTRNFTKWVSVHRTDWTLDTFIANPFPYDPQDETNTSQSDFYIYKFGKAS